ncbi:anti-sigma factor [Alkalicoccus urumqiensis]|uniref:anti-sigma factor n=1 Tax=Alkalicoccus urumqiensis TaxID=1548213 RepID=UPI001158A47C|nr:anti-sigma factor [Alkalicoccus urumqiensis]
MNEHLCDRVIDYFNNQMTDEEKQAFEEHLHQCEACREELKELRELTGELPFMSEPVEPPEGMKARILENVTESTEEEKTNGTEPRTESAVTDIRPEPKKRRRGVPVWAFGAAAAVLLFSIIGNAVLFTNQQQLLSEQESLEERNEELVFERDLLESDYQALLEESDEDDPRGVSDVLLASNLNAAGQEFQGEGSATIISENGHVDLVISVRNMPDLEGEQAFQAWLIEGEVPVSAGSFTIDENGNGAVTYRLSGEESGPDQIDQIAVTLEPQPNNEQPQGDIILASQ